MDIALCRSACRVRLNVDIKVLAKTLEVTNLELLDIDMAGVTHGHWTELRAQVLN